MQILGIIDLESPKSKESAGQRPLPHSLTIGGTLHLHIEKRVTRQAFQPVAGYFLLSMNVRSASRKLPNAIKAIIDWKVSIGIPPFRGSHHKLSCTGQLYQLYESSVYGGLILFCPKRGSRMIEMDETELLESDFSDDSLRAIAGLLNPWVAQLLLLPSSVPVMLPEEAGRRV